MSPAAHVPPPRGPSGSAPLPPDWLPAADLPIEVVAAGTPLYRVHRRAHDPIFYGPGDGQPATYRFDSPSGAFGVLYAALSPAGALVETVVRNSARKMVAYSEIAARAQSVLRSGRDLRLVRLHGTGLSQIGCDNAISTGPYRPCGAWADALWMHRVVPDGIAYQSRHDSGEICLAIFDRQNMSLTQGETTPLLDMLRVVANVLSTYGKSITDMPV